MQDVIDLDHLSRQTFADTDLARELLSLLAGQIADLVPVITGNGPAAARRDAAHTLKGGARAVGAFTLADAAERIEAALGKGAGDVDPAQIAALERAGAAVAHAIAAFERDDPPLAFPPRVS